MLNLQPSWRSCVYFSSTLSSPHILAAETPQSSPNLVSSDQRILFSKSYFRMELDLLQLPPGFTQGPRRSGRGTPAFSVIQALFTRLLLFVQPAVERVCVLPNFSEQRRPHCWKPSVEKMCFAIFPRPVHQYHLVTALPEAVLWPRALAFLIQMVVCEMTQTDVCLAKSSPVVPFTTGALQQSCRNRKCVSFSKVNYHIAQY